MSACGLSLPWGRRTLYNPNMAIAEQDPHASASSHRKIIHIDMDAFYASVEQRDKTPRQAGRGGRIGGTRRRRRGEL